MKVSREDFLRDLNDLIGNNEDKIHMLEDFDDTFTDNSPLLERLTSENERLQKDYDGLMDKYRSRFLSRDEPSTTLKTTERNSDSYSDISYDDLFN